MSEYSVISQAGPCPGGRLGRVLGHDFTLLAQTATSVAVVCSRCGLTISAPAVEQSGE